MQMNNLYSGIISKEKFLFSFTK